VKSSGKERLRLPKGSISLQRLAQSRGPATAVAAVLAAASSAEVLLLQGVGVRSIVLLDAGAGQHLQQQQLAELVNCQMVAAAAATAARRGGRTFGAAGMPLRYNACQWFTYIIRMVTKRLCLSNVDACPVTNGSMCAAPY
jgi:hypothetical protein